MSDELLRGEPRIVEIDERRRRIYELLTDRVPRAASMYYAAVAVLQTDLPDRLPLSAHEMREFIEKLPLELAGVPAEGAQQPQLGAQVRALVNEYDRAARNSGMRSNGEWTGLDGHVVRLLQRLDGFARWFRQHIPSRREQAIGGLQRVDPTPAGLPRSIVEADADLWLRWRTYFNVVAHHTKEATEADFERQLAAVEDLLIRRLAPPTFENQDEMSQLIAEVEGHVETDR
jgi:hypothetical protein